MIRVGPTQPRLTYLRELWHAMQTQEVSGSDALLLLTQRGMDANAAPPPGMPAGPQAPLPPAPAPCRPPRRQCPRPFLAAAVGWPDRGCAAPFGREPARPSPTPRGRRRLPWCTSVANINVSPSLLNISSPGIPMRESAPSRTKSGVLCRTCQPSTERVGESLPTFSPIDDHPDRSWVRMASGAPSRISRAHCSAVRCAGPMSTRNVSA